MEENKKDNTVANEEIDQEEIREKRRKQIETLLLQLKKQASVEDIHKKTHIAIFKIEAIFKRDYKQFDRTTAIGFIRILEREYKINLAPWIVDYDAYCQEYGLFKKDEYDSHTFTDVNMQIDRYEKRTSAKWLNYSIGVIVLVCGLGYWLFNHYKFGEEGSDASKETSKEVVKKVTQEVIEVISPDEETVIIEQPVLDKPAKATSPEQNSTAAKNTVAKNTDSNQSLTQTPVVPQTEAEVLEPEEIVFSVGENVAGRQLWLGVLNVKTKKRSQQIVTGRLVLKSADPLLFVTGHGRFGVNVNDMNLNLQNNSPLFLYYNPGEGVRVVSDAEFREINGGKGW